MPGICPRCSGNVYFAEEKQALGKSWHKLCFVCGHCQKLLDSGSLTEHDGDMFCASCYRKHFGPKGYGFGGGGAGCLGSDDGLQVQRVERVDRLAEAHVAPRKSAARTSRAPRKWGGAEVCPRCDKSVYLAELMRAAGKAWHKGCFTCFHCNKRVDSTTLSEREGEIFCNRKRLT